MKRVKQVKTRKAFKKRKMPRMHKPHTTVKVTVTRKVLGKAPEEYSFVLHDGRKLQSVYELVDELETMTEDTFKQFVTDSENHFANWIEHVFEEKSLADEIRHIKNRMDTQRTLLKHMVRELVKDRHQRRHKK